MKISLCMITWNEEDLLPVAIDSTKGLADEVVVVDTGSTDSTLDVAEQHGAKVIMLADRYHKGQSRNTALDAATGDWCVVLDADERIADPEGLRAFLETTDAQAVYIKLAYVNAEGKPTLSYPQMRCWRKGTYRYQYRAHEVPVPTAGWGKLAHTDFVWEHRPPPDRVWKREYTLKRLLLDVKENPDAARPLYYLGRQYMYLSRWEESIETLKKYIDSSGKHDRADAWHCMAKCYAKLGDKKQQIMALYQACAEQPHRRIWWGELASLYHADGRNEVAAALLKCLLELPLPQQTYAHHVWHGSHPCDLLARCLWKLRRYDEGYKWAKKAVELSPDDARLKKNLQFFANVVESRIEATSSPTIIHQDRCRNVLYLARYDCANVGYRMMQTINNQKDWQARSVTQASDYLRYPKDIFMPSQEVIDELCQWADIIHIFDYWPRNNVVKWGKPLFVSYNGNYYRDHWEFLQKDDAERSIIQLCTTIDLTRYGARWIPVPIDGMPEANAPMIPFVIVHAPTFRCRKGTSYVEKLRELNGVKVDIVEGVSNAECLKRKSVARVCIDQFELGYGVNALEAWKMGVPVIANAEEEIVNLMMNEIGYLPFVQSYPGELGAFVLKLKQDTRFYQRSKQIGTQYINDFHHPDSVAATLIELYEEALG
jgi:tetratricopeptide (TPR) repeat protein